MNNIPGGGGGGGGHTVCTLSRDTRNELVTQSSWTRACIIPGTCICYAPERSMSVVS